MALTDDNSMVMPVAPMYGNGGFGGCGFGGDWGWIILLLLLAGNGWGNGFGYGGGMGGFAADGAALYPWMNQSNQMNDGFRSQMLDTSINGIQNSITSGFGDVQTALCGGFAGVNSNIANGFAQAEIGDNSRQMANMNQMFANQTAMMQGFNNIQSQFADCCCENRLANCQTQNIIQNEGNMTRVADANNTRDLLTNQTANTQAILDKLCQLELDSKNDKIADLERQLTMADLRASQTAQNAFIQQGFSNEVDALYNRLSNCPVPSTPVYGRTPIFTCNNGGCGCGCN